jgi:hypothetical protein
MPASTFFYHPAIKILDGLYLGLDGLHPGVGRGDSSGQFVHAGLNVSSLFSHLGRFVCKPFLLDRQVTSRPGNGKFREDLLTDSMWFQSSFLL